MDTKQYGKREKRLVEKIGMARMWEFNQLVIAIIDKHGIEDWGSNSRGLTEDMQWIQGNCMYKF
ncbi:hypothetical protein [Bacillus cereus]|uniref:hypothetical protein n=1 Tax=Bacillus cereus TaxID=1396 RepID=UPI00211EFDF4|nr:hypothetical protein [Bacillus cereus]